MNAPVHDPSSSSFRPVAHAAEQIVALGGEGACTGADLLRDVLAVCAQLPPARPGSEVLVVCGDRYHVAVAVLAAWERGHAVALPPNSAPETVRELRRRPGVVALLHDTDAADPSDLRPWIAAAPELGPETPGLAAIDGARVLATVYTSGSTGAHQPCPKTAAQLLGEAAALARCFGVEAGRRVIATVPPHHLYGLLFSVLMPLAAGASFVRDTPLHAETVAATARRHGADVLVSVPIHLRSLTVLDPGELPPLWQVFSSGAALPAETAAALGDQLGLAVTEIYGASETGGIAWRRHLPRSLHDEHDPEDMSEAPAWQPLPGVLVDADASGRLLLRSPFLPPDAAVPFVCADQIERGEHGEFRLLGRRDGVLKIGGKRGALAEVEPRLLAQPGLADAAVAAVVAPGPRGQEIVAAVVSRDPNLDPAEVISRVRHGLLQWFDPVVVPRRIKVVTRLPREPSGKLTRASLIALFDRSGGKDGPPRTEFVIRDHSRTGDLHRFSVQVPLDLAFFRGHFAGFPVLPGVAQVVALVLARVRALHPELDEPRAISRLKFRRTIAPGDELELQLQIDVARRRVSFTILRAGEGQRAGEACSAGLLDYAGEFPLAPLSRAACEAELSDMSGGTCV
ncbi:MAG: AMP-binding protein [Nannocystis sp.]|nr:AMP-binding protein [Nannocystis sp.]MBA3547268.1 AMP-binding protein [Nannocystis sp.]